jgi:hypothetical protein
MLCSECKSPGHNIRTCPLRKECPVCFEKITTKNVTVTKCGHEFCTTCLLKSAMRNGECPMCREKLCENIVTRTFKDSKEMIIKRSLDDFGILDRFPDILDDDDFKLKIIEDFVYFSHLILHYSMEELNS